MNKYAENLFRKNVNIYNIETNLLKFNSFFFLGCYKMFSSILNVINNIYKNNITLITNCHLLYNFNLYL